MNKTVTINISGIIFNIDEGAFDKLQGYLHSIKQKFGSTKGGEEILIDIEARIAEIFHEKVNDRKQVISQFDVDEVIAIMGQPEQFEVEDSESNSSRKVYEEESYYEQPQKGPKRFFRDPESKVLGGVCSGTAHYFGVDPILIRLLFVAIVFFGGSGVIIYLILWAITPEAKTTSDRLQMKGHKVDIDSIRQSVGEEAEQLKKKFSHLGEKADQFGRDVDSGKIKGFFGTLFNFIFSIVKLVLTFIGKFFGIILIILGGLFLLSLVASLFGLGNMNGMSHIGWNYNSFSIKEMYDILFLTSYQRIAITVGLGLAAGIPILAMLYAGLKILFNIQSPPKSIGGGVTLAWFAGIVLLIVTGLQIGNEFSKEDKVISTFSLAPTVADTIYLSANDSHFPIDAVPYDDNDEFFVLKSYEDELYLTSVEMNITENNTDSITIKVVQEAHGATYKGAVERAENIEYSYSITDNSIKFDPYFILRKKDLYRQQSVKIIVSIPVGKTVYLDKTSGWLIYDIKNTTSTRDKYMLGNYWTMTENGLECLHLDMTKDGIRSRRKDRGLKQSRKPVVPKFKIKQKVVAPGMDTSTTATILRIQTNNKYPVFPTPFNVLG
jgi:phage shock protein PspC (stress-responsive transcriptional regulator)|tara:strand:+ start:877 stop:2697 length:1821 start_codon:yes stop_codon:yes gene_type:complete